MHKTMMMMSRDGLRRMRGCVCCALVRVRERAAHTRFLKQSQCFFRCAVVIGMKCMSIRECTEAIPPSHTDLGGQHGEEGKEGQEGQESQKDSRKEDGKEDEA